MIEKIQQPSFLLNLKYVHITLWIILKIILLKFGHFYKKIEVLFNKEF